jgi:GntR family transcriptional regulator
MHARGKHPNAKVLQLERVPAPSYVARTLRIKLGEAVVLLKRLRLADDEPVAVETAHLPYSLCAGLLDEHLDGCSLYELLTKKYHIFPTHAEQQLEAVTCPAAEARLLSVRAGSPVLHIYRTTYGRDGNPFEVVESFYRGDKYVFYAELHAE